MRGAHIERVRAFFGTGIIPADAGSTAVLRVWPSCSGDHPRGCGEHLLSAFEVAADAGSSPRMRGAHIGAPTLLRGVGIIPADAGSTRRLRRSWLTTEDHPRGCGEHRRCPRCHRHSLGSSPRMRGAQFPEQWKSPATRIIPADAGSTAISQSGIFRPKDHPRGCGEHRQPIRRSFRSAGSSPRMRGAHIPCVQERGGVGIIPADAGSTYLALA